MAVIQGLIVDNIMEIHNFMPHLDEVPEWIEGGIYVEEIKTDFPPPKERATYNQICYDLIKKEFFAKVKQRELTKEEKLEDLVQEVRIAKNPSRIEYYEELDKEKSTMEEIRTAKFDAIKETCDNKILAGFHSPSMDADFGFSFTDQMNMTQSMIIFMVDSTPIMWKTEDKGLIEIRKEQFVQVSFEAGAHKEKQINHWWQLKANILAAQTKEEIMKIEWEGTIL